MNYINVIKTFSKIHVSYTLILTKTKVRVYEKYLWFKRKLNHKLPQILPPSTTPVQMLRFWITLWRARIAVTTRRFLYKVEREWWKRDRALQSYILLKPRPPLKQSPIRRDEPYTHFRIEVSLNSCKTRKWTFLK